MGSPELRTTHFGWLGFQNSYARELRNKKRLKSYSIS
ncbi:hypothetical protein MESS4_330055 [Mesorhizobium sp. STM 4661]|nr:hypothetical protein MESS4_330055 [Mesorhizobium sp. STM 4661]